ncbi:hypothetical protein ABZ502_17790 [Streptomyces abikoensis]|uniref:hypothetical protein n=1 Tax=Streptomyces abikoensis TaxID=97398 RepID=UPI0033FA9D46
MRTSPRTRRLLLAIGALAALQLAAASPATGLLLGALGSAAGLALWFRANRTAATAMLSTAVTLMVVPAVIEWIGERAGVPEAIASWEVVPLWALTLAVPAGAWLAARHTGSRAVTVVVCHAAICVAAIPAPVFPATALSIALVSTLCVLFVRSGAAAALRLRLHQARRRAHDADSPRPVRDGQGRLWLATELPETDRILYVGPGGQVTVVHRMLPGRITLGRVSDSKGTAVRAYTLNGSAGELVDVLTDFAVADRTLAQKLNLGTAQVTTVVAAPHAGLSDRTVPIDLAGIWDKTAHQYADHRVTLLASADPEKHLQDLPVARPPRHLSMGACRPTRAERDQEHGDRRQRRVAVAAGCVE